MVRFLLLTALAGLIGGCSASLFIWLLNQAQHFRNSNSLWIFTLPLSGIFIAWLALRFRKGFPEGSVLVLGSFLTHLGGGSAGREGAIIHFGRIASHRSGELLSLPSRRLKKLVMVTMGAAFGAALNAPIAGTIFGLEYQRSPLLRFRTLASAALANAISHFVVHGFGTHHFDFPSFEMPSYEFENFLFISAIGVFLGFLTAFFHFMRKRMHSHLSAFHPLLGGFLGGLTLLALYLLFDLQKFQGLGFESIVESTQHSVPFAWTLQKMVLTILTLGSGFQGGEFVPLAFMGSTFGSAFGGIHPVLIPLFSAVGYVATYGAATQTPIACTLLAAELFGWSILPYAAVVLFLASRVHSRLIEPIYE